MPVISSGYGRTIEQEAATLERKLAWVQRIIKCRKRLDSIGDIVKLGCLWRDPKPWASEKTPTLRLVYTGAAKDHVEAAVDLSRILDALRCAELDLRHVGSGQTRPTGQYRGKGKLWNLHIKIEMAVPWLPVGCHVHTYGERRYQCVDRSYSVSCSRTRR